MWPNKEVQRSVLKMKLRGGGEGFTPENLKKLDFEIAVDPKGPLSRPTYFFLF